MTVEEIIVAAAVRYGKVICVLPAPARHGDIIRECWDMLNRDIDPLGLEAQGFLTSKGRFVGRIEARDIAVQAMGIQPNHARELFSEDLW